MTRRLLSRKERTETSKYELVRQNVLDRQFELEEFVNHYEDLVEVLCSAAQFGATPKLERLYADLRHAYPARYRGLRPFLISYLEFVPNDGEAGLKLCGRPLDAFEALVAAVDLREFMEQDDGSMISRINRTRGALTLYGEHLRLLAARVA